MMTKVGDEYHGPGGTFVNLVCRKMNVTPVFVETPDSYGWQDGGTFTGAIGAVAYGRADVCFNQFFVKNYHVTKLVPGLYLNSDQLCVLTPKAPPIPGHLIILRVFTLKSWFMIILTHAIISLLYTGMRMTIGEDDRRQTRRTYSEASPSSFRSNDASFAMYDMARRDTDAKLCARNVRAHETIYETKDEEILSRKYCTSHKNPRLYCFMKNEKTLGPVCLSSMIKYLREVFLQLLRPLENARSRLSERLLLICSLITSLILTGLFTSQLTAHYSKHTYFKEIRTFEDLKEIGLPILSDARDVLQDAVGKDDHLELKKYNLRMEYANDTELRRRLIYAKDAAILRTRGFIRWKYNDEEIERINIIEHCPITYLMAPLLTKDSPFLQPINDIIGRLHNGGLYRKWIADGLLNRQLEAYRKKPGKHQKLTLDHFFIPFAIWFVGLTIGTIVFAFERKVFNA